MDKKLVWRFLLIVADEDQYPIIQNQLSESLYKKAELICVPTIAEGFSFLERCDFDLVLVGDRLEDGLGTDLIRQMVSNEHPAPFILITGDSSCEVNQEALEAGAVFCLEKGDTDFKNLGPVIRQAVQIKKVEKELRQRLDDAERKAAYTEKELIRALQKIEGLKAAMAKAEGEKPNQQTLIKENNGVRSILERITDGFVAWDSGWRYTYVNSAAEKLLGISRENLLGRDILSIFKEEDIQQIGVHLKKAMVELAPTNFVEFFPPLKKWVAVQAYPSQEGMSLYFRDVSDRIKALEIKQESEKRFHHLADSMPQLVWTVLPDRKVEYINQRVVEDLGLDSVPKEWPEWAHVLHPDDQGETSRAWEMAAQESRIFQVEHRVRMADGSYRWHLSRAFPICDKEGQVIRWFGTGTDIHDLKQTKEVLHISTQRLSILSDAASQLLSSMDPTSLLEEIYSRLSNVMGFEAYIQYQISKNGKYLELGSSAGFSEEVKRSLQKLELGMAVCGTVALEKKPFIINDVQNSSDPRVQLIKSLGITAYICHPLLVKNRLIGTLSFGSRKNIRFEAVDVEMLRAVSNLVAASLYRHRTDLDLIEYANRLENSNQELQEFAFLASHDLNEPLRKIESFGALLLNQTGCKLTPNEIDTLKRMQNAASRMRDMVNGLLDLSRIKTQARPFREVDLYHVAQEALSDLDLLVKKTRGKVDLGPLPVIYGDPAQMHQLLQNLIGNALKFHRAEVPPHVVVSYETETDSTITIKVTDHGIGFDEKHLRRIFLPFERLGGKTKVTGSGMGLAICRKIVEHHGGSITASSKPGEGTTFMVTLPISHKEEVRTAADAPG
jgi:PAS domain S-box-containing protein